jgi:hypothetical protein
MYRGENMTNDEITKMFYIIPGNGFFGTISIWKYKTEMS